MFPETTKTNQELGDLQAVLILSQMVKNISSRIIRPSWFGRAAIGTRE